MYTGSKAARLEVWKRRVQNQNQCSNQGWLHDLQDSEQNENVCPLFKTQKHSAIRNTRIQNFYL